MPDTAPNDAVKLGLARVLVEPVSISEWASLGYAIHLFQPKDEEGKAILDVVYALLTDEGVGLDGECLVVEDVAWMRITITPSDSPGSKWKRSRSSTRQGLLRKLFGFVQQVWEVGEAGRRLFDLVPEDYMRMSDLYAAIPSPPPMSLAEGNHALDTQMATRLMNHEEPDGIATEMYQYQFRSVGRMLQMETDPVMLVDPLFTTFTEAGDGSVYHVNLDTMDVQRQPAWYDMPRGGILCEQMGVGKTLMCLSLICATLHQPCLPSPASINISKITTSVRVQSYPFQSDHDLRQRVNYTGPLDIRLPSLTEMCADILAIVDPQGLDHHSVPLELSDLYRHRRPLYYDFPQEDDCVRAVKRRRTDTTPMRIFLANTTLVIVPTILKPQWQAEIKKHVKPGALKVTVVEKEMPPLRYLISCDIVLMSVDRFGAEEGVWRATGEESVLMQARWKRMILDEGHVAASKSANAMRLAIKMSVERRWAVSGTPTRHLQQGGEVEPIVADQPTPSDGSTTTSRVWSKKDLDDAARIGAIVGGYLAAEPFKSDAGFQQTVTAHLRGTTGPRIGAVSRIHNLMCNLMVKHQRHVLDAASTLPPSTHTVISIPLHPMQRVTYNALAALVAGNVYTSNSSDRDHFLHPSNAASFAQVIKNLHLACFWYTARGVGVASSLERCQHFLDDPDNDNIPIESRKGLEEAIVHLQRALDAPGWCDWMENSISVPFEAPGIPRRVRDAWSDGTDLMSDAIDAQSLLRLREINFPGATEHDLHIRGWDNRALRGEEFHQEMIKEKNRATRQERVQAKAKAKGQETEEVKAHDHIGKGTSKDKAKHQSNGKVIEQKAIRHASDALKLKLRGRKKDPLQVELDKAARNAQKSARSSRTSVTVDLGPRPLDSILDTSSRSTKLNYVIKAVLEADKADKFIIFGNYVELGHVTEALDLYEVKSCFAGTTNGNVQRLAAIDLFKTDPEMRVCLLDLKVTARGLNLIEANRMIFLSPVWNLDIQAQAIKRIHRIGQTRPTKIEFLVAQGTFEEDIANRAANARSEKEEVSYTRGMIERPRFVYEESGSIGSIETFPIRMVPAAERKILATPRTSTPELEVDVEGGDSPLSPGLVTPFDRAGLVSLSISPTSPSNDRAGPLKCDQSDLGLGGMGEVKKKRARVAFADDE